MGIEVKGKSKEQWRNDWRKKTNNADLEQLFSERYHCGGFGKNGTGQKESKSKVAGHHIKLSIDRSGQQWVTHGGGSYNPPNAAIGAVIALDQAVLGKDTSPHEAGRILAGAAPSAGIIGASRPVTAAKDTRPREPQKAEGDQLQAVYAYLSEERGISRSTSIEVQSEGFMTLTANGPAFAGYDENGELRCVETRLLKSMPDGSKHSVTAGSSRDFPPILRGNGGHLHIVEGGMDALGLKEILKRKGEDGTILVAGGSSRSWLEQQHCQKLIKDSAGVTIWGENEASAEIQVKTDAGKQEVAQTVIKIRGGNEGVSIKRPPKGIKDPAEWNKVEKDTARVKEKRAVGRSISSH